MIAIQVILEMNFSLSSNDDAIVHSIFVTSRATFYSIPLPTPLPYHCFLAKTIDTRQLPYISENTHHVNGALYLLKIRHNMANFSSSKMAEDGCSFAVL